MKDTASDVEAAYTALFASRSAADRLRMTCDMFDAAKTLMAAGIRANEPAISSEDLRIRMFERLYVDDFDQPTYHRIIRALRDIR
jgi:hypothetical protein